MSFLRPILQEKDYVVGVPILPRVDDEPYWVDGPYPPGFDPPAFFHIGPIVSANNQRPEAPPGCAKGAIALVIDGLPMPIDSDTRFIASMSSKLAEVKTWKTNSTLQAEFDTYADGVRKNQMIDASAPSRRQEAEDEVKSLYKRAAALRRAAEFDNRQFQRRYAGIPPDERPPPAQQQLENQERDREVENLLKQAAQVQRQYQLVGAPIDALIAAGPQIAAPEGEGVNNYQYGNAQVQGAPVRLAGPTAADKANQAFFNQAPGMGGLNAQGQYDPTIAVGGYLAENDPNRIEHAGLQNIALGRPGANMRRQDQLPGSIAPSNVAHQELNRHFHGAQERAVYRHVAGDPRNFRD